MKDCVVVGEVFMIMGEIFWYICYKMIKFLVRYML